MGLKKTSLSGNELCLIYQCLDGHIHFKYRNIDLALTSEDFFQVAGAITEALSVLKNDDAKSLADIETSMVV